MQREKADVAGSHASCVQQLQIAETRAIKAELLQKQLKVTGLSRGPRTGNEECIACPTPTRPFQLQLPLPDGRARGWGVD